jgi:pimeloyl-ACP methyl ester carboxylesterase
MKYAELAYDLVPAISKSVSSLPIFILHGLLGNRLNFLSLAKRKEISGYSDVYVVDLRNHGWSQHMSEHSAESMSADIVHFMSKRAISEAIMVGFSMGGKAAMHLAFNNPSRFKGLLLLDCGPFNYPSFNLPDVNFQHVLDELSSINLSSHSSKSQIEQELRSRLGENKQQSDFLLSNLIIPSGSSIESTETPIVGPATTSEHD